MHQHGNSIYAPVLHVPLIYAFPPQCHFRGFHLPRRKGGGAAEKVRTRYQGGTLLPSPGSSAPNGLKIRGIIISNSKSPTLRAKLFPVFVIAHPTGITKAHVWH